MERLARKPRDGRRRAHTRFSAVVGATHRPLRRLARLPRRLCVAQPQRERLRRADAPSRPLRPPRSARARRIIARWFRLRGPFRPLRRPLARPDRLARSAGGRAPGPRRGLRRQNAPGRSGGARRLAARLARVVPARPDGLDQAAQHARRVRTGPARPCGARTYLSRVVRAKGRSRVEKWWYVRRTRRWRFRPLERGTSLRDVGVAHAILLADVDGLQR
jgi:hypothetical protein